ncbi:MAG: class I SAM-dependent RNA methyltransferase [Pseudomonadota bacterium]
MSDQVVIERLGAQGDGISAGGGLYVPYTLPGEHIRVIGHGARARPAEILTPAPERVTPVCPHFGACGGCALQHATDPFVADWKRARVVEALAARGIENVEMRPMLTSPPGSRRRITVAARRLKDRVLLGFHGRGEGDLVAIDRCAVAHPALAGLLPNLAELVDRTASRKRALRLILTLAKAGIDVAVAGGKPLDRPGMALLAGVAARAGLARLGWEGEEVVTLAPPYQSFGRAKVLPPPGAFMQPTADGEAALLASVQEICGDAAHVVDLFAGMGTFALPLAETAEVLAVEWSAPAVEAMASAWRSTGGLKRLTAQSRDLHRRAVLARELQGVDAVVMDPPRAGARAQAEEIAKSAVPRVAMVSCNPATFARDARILIDGGFRLAWVQPIDQFRWSAHVELAAAFLR